MLRDTNCGWGSTPTSATSSGTTFRPPIAPKAFHAVRRAEEQFHMLHRIEGHPDALPRCANNDSARFFSSVAQTEDRTSTPFRAGTAARHRSRLAFTRPRTSPAALDRGRGVKRARGHHFPVGRSESTPTRTTRPGANITAAPSSKIHWHAHTTQPSPGLAFFHSIAKRQHRRYSDETRRPAQERPCDIDHGMPSRALAQEPRRWPAAKALDELDDICTPDAPNAIQAVRLAGQRISAAQRHGAIPRMLTRRSGDGAR